MVSPPLPCTDDQEVPRDAISKVVVSPILDAEAEVAANRLLQQIDPRRRFTLPMLGTCPVLVSDVRRGTDGRCNQQGMWARWPSTHLTQILYPHGGRDLQQIMGTRRASTWPGVLALVRRFGNVLRGLQVLVRKGYCHLDLKAANVLCGSGPEGIMRLHDWSWLTRADHVFDTHCRWCVVRRLGYAGLRSHYMDYHAPEMRAFGTPAFLKRAALEEPYGMSATRDPVARAQFARFQAKLVLDLVGNDRIQVFTRFTPKLDVYSCGYLLHQLLQLPAPRVPPPRLAAAAEAARSLAAMMYDQDPYSRATISRAVAAHRRFEALLAAVR